MCFPKGLCSKPHRFEINLVQSVVSNTMHIASLYKFDSCLFIRLFVCHLSFTFFNGSWLNQIKSKHHQTFCILKYCSPKLIKNALIRAWHLAHTHNMWKHGHNFVSFCYFLPVIWSFEAFPHWKWKKDITLKKILIRHIILPSCHH